ncbi:protein FAM177A1 isoform X4 [Mixophyes fleayi]|uniref:protein FAM177A1 isoform X4 n=1 Tax=Mixophyes fleayi TaxID=3061075 RepID=UPI003F4DAC36
MATGQVMTSGDREFECVELGDIRKKKKVPRRIIHFASGETMEEYSTDEEEELQERKDLLPTADPFVTSLEKKLPPFWGSVHLSTSMLLMNITECRKRWKRRRKRMKCQNRPRNSIKSSAVSSRMKAILSHSSHRQPAPLSTSVLYWKKSIL